MHEHTVEHSLAAHFKGLASFRTRKKLQASELYRRLAAEIERVTAATEHGRYTGTAQPRSFVRAAAWNIERGGNLEQIVEYLRSDAELAAADVLLLSEVDIGMQRSSNRNIGREIAERLGYDYVFGNSYVSLDGVRSGADNEVGLHGNAILSRFPFARFDNVPVLVTKDKFGGSEPRLGAKKALVAQLEAPFGPVAVAVAHLDSHASPTQRAGMLRDLLGAIQAKGYPERTLVGGDLNTSTYDVRSTWRVLASLARKMARGGFPHAIDHYMRPYALYEREVFDAFRDHGFDWQSFNDMGAPTFRYEVGDGQSEDHVRGYLAGPAVALLRWKLKPWGGVAPIKIDWFAGRGLRSLGNDELTDGNGGRPSVAPSVREKPTVAGKRVSDHDPIVVDVVA